MQYSPKLKNAAEDIKAILNKYDIAASIVLHAPGFSEFLLEITPSYSCATLQHDHIHFKAKRSDYKDELKRQNDIRDTANMMYHLSRITGENAIQLLTVAKAFDELTGAEYDTDGNMTSHTTQNN